MKKSSNSYLQTILSFAALGIAIYAIIISQKSLDNSNSQFEQNMQSADSLFNYQLKHSKQLNDSLIYQISELQKITNNQLEITDRQLQVSIQTLQEEVYSRRPKIIILKNKILDTNFVFEEKWFSPEIETHYRNIGKRSAKNLRYRCFVLYPDLSNLRYGDHDSKNDVDPEQSTSFDFRPKIPIKFRHKFYYCFEMEYYDEVLKKEFYQVHYFNYYLTRGKYEFNYCDIDESGKIRKAANKIFKKNNLKLFDN